MGGFPDPKRPPTAHPVDVGLRSETAVLATLVRLGYDVLVPHGTNHRYDLVVDTDDGFIRIQCKTGVHRDGVVIFRSQSVRSNTRGALVRTYVGEIDFFAVHSPVSGQVFMVPCDETTRRHTTLRFDPPANGQVKASAGRRTTRSGRSRRGGSNPCAPDYKSGALPTELLRPVLTSLGAVRRGR